MKTANSLFRFPLSTKSYLFLLIGTLIFCSIPTITQGQDEPGTHEVRDQSQLSSSGSYYAPNRWQSFTAGQNGYLSKVRAYHYNTTESGTLYIYEGEGTHGRVLHEQSYTANGTEFLFFPMTTPVPLIKDRKYTIQFSNFRWFVSGSDVYAGGRSSYSANRDLVFETYVKPAKTIDSKAFWQRDANMINHETSGFINTINADDADVNWQLVVRRGNQIQISDPEGLVPGPIRVRNKTLPAYEQDWDIDGGLISLDKDMPIGVYEVESPVEIAGNQIIVLFNPFMPDVPEYYPGSQNERDFWIHSDRSGYSRITPGAQTMEYRRYPLDIYEPVVLRNMLKLLATGASQEATLDQSQHSSSGGYYAPNRWQSFTAGRNGYLTKVRAYHYNTSESGTLYIYEGEGTQGQVLHEQSYTASGTEFLFFTMTTPVPLIKDRKYTIQFSNFRWFVSGSDVYAGGRSSYSADRDLVFETYVRPTETAPNPIKHLSEPWNVMRSFTWLFHDKDGHKGVAHAQWDHKAECPDGLDHESCQGAGNFRVKNWLSDWEKFDRTIWTANCQDFAGMFCAAGRLLGVASRVVQGGQVGQDEVPTDRVLDISSGERSAVDGQGNRTEVLRTRGNNALWGNHIWAEAYLNSSPLSQLSGWYVAEPTPSIVSMGRHQAGPVPLAKVKANDASVPGGVDPALGQEIAYFIAMTKGYVWLGQKAVRRYYAAISEASLPADLFDLESGPNLSFEEWQTNDYKPERYACFLNKCIILGGYQGTTITDLKSPGGHIYTQSPFCTDDQMDQIDRKNGIQVPLGGVSNYEIEDKEPCLMTTTELYKRSFQEGPFDKLPESQVPLYVKRQIENSCNCPAGTTSNFE